MSRYIDADELLNALQGQVSEVCNKIPYDKEVFTILHDRQMEIYNLIEKQPTVEAVEVVRCKDCKYRIKNAFGLGIICDKIGTYMPMENDYYSYGAVQRWIKRRWSDDI